MIRRNSIIFILRLPEKFIRTMYKLMSFFMLEKCYVKVVSSSASPTFTSKYFPLFLAYFSASRCKTHAWWNHSLNQKALQLKIAKKSEKYFKVYETAKKRKWKKGSNPFCSGNWGKSQNEEGTKNFFLGGNVITANILKLHAKPGENVTRWTNANNVIKGLLRLPL